MIKRDPLYRIEQEKESLLNLTIDLANINSHSRNIAGLTVIADLLSICFFPLGDESSFIELKPYTRLGLDGKKEHLEPPKALHISKRKNAPIQVFFSIHYDTVFPITSLFQKVKFEDDKIIGPGVLDAKAGIAIILNALKAFELTPYSEKIGWEILLNPDEEMGSPSSISVLQRLSKRHHLALVYEPPLIDRSMINSRKGSGNFTIVVHGKKAHAGRDHHLGVNAIDALSEIILKLSKLTGKREGLTVNVGQVIGGSAVNVVPDIAGCHFNVRVKMSEDIIYVQNECHKLIQEYNQKKGLRVDFDGRFLAPPKLLNDKTQRLCDAISKTSDELGEPLKWTETGGVCDGNRIAAMGVPVIDTMGALGGSIHSDSEYLLVESLVKKTQLTTLFLMNLADGQFKNLIDKE